MSDAAVTMVPGPAPAAVERGRPDPLRPFARLDAILSAGVAEARERFGADGAHDAFRGLYITEQQALSELRHPAGQVLGVRRTGGSMEPGWDDVARDHPGWTWLREAFGLTDTELDVVLIALAPEADLRYERLYGYLQDDVSRRRPTVNLTLDLVSASGTQKVAHRSLLAPGAPLLRDGLVRLVPEDRAAAPPLLAHVVVLDEQVTAALLLQDRLDRSLASCCRLLVPPAGTWARVPLPAPVRHGVLAAARSATGRRALVIHLHGQSGRGRHAAAEALAGELGLPMLELTTTRLPGDDDEAALAVSRVFREAGRRGALVLVDGAAGLPAGSRRREALADAVARDRTIAVLSDAEPWQGLADPALGALDVGFAPPDLPTRRSAWTRALAEAGVEASPDLPAVLGERFTFGPDRIAAAVAGAAASTAAGYGPTAGELFAAARRQTSHRLSGLAKRLPPASTWGDIVLPPETTARLAELCARVRLRSTVLHEWGFESKAPRSLGTSALFTGPPGTGKTTAAEVVAGELGLDLFSIDLSAVVSKYIGETEKNLEQIFAAADDADAVLMFDEADALFGKRSDVHDAHDRYANIETSFLLQRMEQYDGIAILATNRRENLDEAFTRRLQFVIDFPFPEEEQREGIWRISIPGAAPLADDVDPVALARDYRLTGAAIKNAVLHAAYLAADSGRPICADLLHQAVRREFQKMGRVAPEPADRLELSEAWR